MHAPRSRLFWETQAPDGPRQKGSAVNVCFRANCECLLLSVLLRDESPLSVQLDALAVDQINLPPLGGERLQTWVDPLVITVHGAVMPWTYGISSELALGDLQAASFAGMASRFMQDGREPSRAFQEMAVRRLRGHPWPYINFHEALRRLSHQIATERLKPHP